MGEGLLLLLLSTSYEVTVVIVFVYCDWRKLVIAGNVHEKPEASSNRDVHIIYHTKEIGNAVYITPNCRYCALSLNPMSKLMVND